MDAKQLGIRLEHYVANKVLHLGLGEPYQQSCSPRILTGFRSYEEAIAWNLQMLRESPWSEHSGAWWHTKMVEAGISVILKPQLFDCEKYELLIEQPSFPSSLVFETFNWFHPTVPVAEHWLPTARLIREHPASANRAMCFASIITHFFEHEHPSLDDKQAEIRTTPDAHTTMLTDGDSINILKKEKSRSLTHLKPSALEFVIRNGGSQTQSVYDAWIASIRSKTGDFIEGIHYPTFAAWRNWVTHK